MAINQQELTEALAKLGARHAVGEEWHSFSGKIPAGGVPYLGQDIDKEMWIDLYSWAVNQGLMKTISEWESIASANNSNCKFYGYDVGSTTFRVPKVVGYLKGSANIDETGSHIDEGLPNITGKIAELGHISGVHYGMDLSGAEAGGSFVNDYKNNVNEPTSLTPSKPGLSGFRFDASLSSSIYGNSSHVTPETSIVLFGVYGVGTISFTGSADADAVLNAVNLERTYADTKIAKVDSLTWEEIQASTSASLIGKVPSASSLKYVINDRIHQVYIQEGIDISSSATVSKTFVCPSSGYYCLSCMIWNSGVPTYGCGIRGNNAFPAAKSYSYDNAQAGCSIAGYFSAGEIITYYGQWVSTSTQYRPPIRLCGFYITLV